ncbi:MAG: putative ATPase [Osedax symbiont Rs1]|nr:MAG: putative ATPase [Osedax symbiont Rs1]
MSQINLAKNINEVTAEVKISDDKEASTRLNKVHRKLRREMGRAVLDYKMIEQGDRIMVCLSGGKDSFVMLDLLMSLQRNAPVQFDLIAVNLDQKQPGFPEHILPEYLEKMGIEYYIVERDTYSVVRSRIPEGKKTCGLCSRLRRGTLYSFAEDINANKIALGHHKDDIIETLFLNMFNGGRLAGMPPKLLSDDKRNIVIRPLAYAREKDIIEYASFKQFPIIPCNLCGSQENLQRQNIKQMLQQWEIDQPGRIESIFGAMQNVAPSQMSDKSLFDFENLAIDRTEQRPEYEYSNGQQVHKSRTKEQASKNVVQIIEAMSID